MVHRAVVADRVPDGERDAEVALPADRPVRVQPLHPRAVTVRHERREPVDLLATREQTVAQPKGRDEPLARGHDLQGSLALLVELDGVRDGPRLAEERAGGGEQLDDGGLGLLHGPARELGVGLVGRGGVVGLEAGLPERRGLEAPVAADERTQGQPEVAPPRHVGRVAERADHRDPAALVGLGELVGEDRDAHREQRRDDRGPEQRAVARVVGVRDECDARGEQLGPRRLDLDGPDPVGQGEGKAVIRAGVVAVLELGLGRPRCGSRRPTASAPRSSTPRLARGAAGTRAGSGGGSAPRRSSTRATSPPRARAGARAP